MIICGEAIVKCPNLPTVADLDLNRASRLMDGWFGNQVKYSTLENMIFFCRPMEALVTPVLIEVVPLLTA